MGRYWTGCFTPVLKRAQQNVPQAHYVEAFAEKCRFQTISLI